MSFTSFSKAFVALVLASQATALPSPGMNALSKRDETIIGYRRVSPAQGEDYNNNDNRLTDDGSSANGQQIGAGVYTAMGPDTYILDDGEPDWYCVLTAEDGPFQRLGKAWIPPSMWFKSEEELSSHITGLESSWDPAKTLRMATIAGQDEEDYQMVIPPALVPDADLDIRVFCYDTKEAMNEEWDTGEDIDYDDEWQNVKGDPEDDD
ncbi:hypothetical protein DL766_008937 [Monosporascus sp. MC13-8B]|uniref:Uncharacterized protein n=1 Tax=Monosporascus cannonballus TaxID=155416 RepID=A0ABY0GV32_9PEZI|nr:hypothetical protein DL762_008819 [Monosporascus cannonballus]RYO78763.1 hypothetical protein DL763_009518 [Monosporascus cannonballus]RYP17274.1 hypothetical protein DL766_008937 [Monosporascus sp. MC13-8B]